jgi:hypothetical protein
VVAVISRFDCDCVFRVGEHVVNHESDIGMEYVKEIASSIGC